MNSIEKLTAMGQSLWYDNIQRKLLQNGELEAMIARGDIRGVTSNPSIFNNAIANSTDYDSALIPLAWSGWDSERIFWQLAIEDIQQACDLFLPLYEESNRGDGYVSLEVSPYLAHDTDKTVEQAVALWERVNRPNLMVKIPATPEGIPAIRQALAAGVNINVTLIFSLDRYTEVMEAYLSGLEDRLKEDQPIDHIASVASFFVSRVDSKVDKQLAEDSPLRGQAAVANARLAYQAFLNTFRGERWETLEALGARVQRPLWASTSTKNPAYPETLYVDSLIGAHTVNTVPPKTLEAFRNQGTVSETISEEHDQAETLFPRLTEAGVSMEVVTQELEEEGVKSFADAFSALLATIDERRGQAASQLGPLAASVSDRVSVLEAESVPARLWEGDAALWTEDKAGQAEVSKRLGWLRLPESSQSLLTSLGEFASKVHGEGIDRVLLLGMGGSSLAPEVLSHVFAAPDPETAQGKPCLSILDSTDPVQIAWAAENYPPEKSLYLVSSKSGRTAEVLAFLEYFWKESGQDGSRFIAITDPGSPLEKLAHDRGFRRIFSANPEVGGRYSALTAFGLVPAALLGLDTERLLASGQAMMAQSGREVTAARNPGMVLGAVMAEAVSAGRDKLTILADETFATVGSWLEQLVAESSGKQDKGIVPVDREPPGKVSAYGQDRLFVYLRKSGEHDDFVSALRNAHHPVLEFRLSDPYDLGAEFYRWEVATAIACHILGVNAFDQPNVEDAKMRAKAKIAEYQEQGSLPAGEYIELNQAGTALQDFLNGTRERDYIALNAFLPRNQETYAILQELRIAIRKRAKAAVTLGYGPRFLHSTGQLHKGGPNNGLFLLLTAEANEDIEIPTQGMSFGTLQQAQALGDYEALQARGRRILHIHLPGLAELQALIDLVSDKVSSAK